MPFPGAITEKTPIIILAQDTVAVKGFFRF
jgi:hypothetical protein